MERDEYYDVVRGAHIIRVRDDERSLQMAFEPSDFTRMNDIAKDRAYLLMENKLEFYRICRAIKNV